MGMFALSALLKTEAPRDVRAVDLRSQAIAAGNPLKILYIVHEHSTNPSVGELGIPSRSVTLPTDSISLQLRAVLLEHSGTIDLVPTSFMLAHPLKVSSEY